jgi:hypothetical protein
MAAARRVCRRAGSSAALEVFLRLGEQVMGIGGVLLGGGEGGLSGYDGGVCLGARFVSLTATVDLLPDGG